MSQNFTINFVYSRKTSLTRLESMFTKLTNAEWIMYSVQIWNVCRQCGWKFTCFLLHPILPLK